MRHPRFYAAVMALLLIAQCGLFNWLEHDPHHLSTFPWLLGLATVPVVMFLAVRQRLRSSGGAGGRELRRFGWSALWPASLAFALFVAALSAVYFGPSHLPVVLFSFVTALATTLLVGFGSTEVAAVIFTRTTISGARNGAA
jgi:hypothetical protein